MTTNEKTEYLAKLRPLVAIIDEQSTIPEVAARAAQLGLEVTVGEVRELALLVVAVRRSYLDLRRAPPPEAWTRRRRGSA